MTDDSDPLGPNDLLLVRKLKAPRPLVWRCWTEPDLLAQWFCPMPWTVTDPVIDLRPGGRFASTMHGPAGERMANEGMWLHIEPLNRLVFTDLMLADWHPAEAGFFVADVRFADLADGGTRYSAKAMHRTQADRDRHAEMGFEGGWGVASEQLDALALTLM